MSAVKKLWNKNFAILFQGQFISDFGNAAFSVALGFWVLQVTNSTAMMGTIMACFALPRVLVGPFAGAVADRLSRKWIIVAADFIRGILYTLLGATVFFKVFPFNAIYPIAILTGICDAFFNPAMSSAIPDIVPVDDLSKANSARSVSTTLSQLVGNALGGVLYALLTAPVMILANGISFLYASVTQLFMKIPFTHSTQKRQHILRDMLDGVKYSFGHRGIRMLLLSCMALNFFAMVGITLLTPLFHDTPGFGVKMYGYTMAAMMIGAVLGMVVLSIVKVKPANRSKLFGFSMVAMVCSTVPIGFVHSAVWMFPLAFITGINNAIVNMMIQTILQSTIPSENRGKVFGIVGTVAGALMPLAMAASGFIALVLGVRLTIILSFSLMAIGVLPLLFDKHFKAFINTDIEPAKQIEEAVAPEAIPMLAPAEDEA